MAGEGRRLEEVIGNEEHDFASSSARSLPIWPTCALIQEIVRQRSDWLKVFREDIVFLTSCEVTRVLCNASKAVCESVKIFTYLSSSHISTSKAWAAICIAVISA